MTEEAYSLIAIIDKVKGWHHDRNLIEGSTDKDQYLKLIQEAGELSDNICKGKDIKDDIGDMMVVLINIAERNGISLTECLLEAWHDIKDRKGRMVDGVFVKETDDYDTNPENWQESGVKVKFVEYTVGENTKKIERRATGSLDGPGFDLTLENPGDWDLENDPESQKYKYKNTACGVTKY